VTALCARLGIRHPIVQAPMAGVATPRLAARVSEAGGLGSIGLAGVDVDAAAAMISAIREATDAPFHVNLFCHRAPDRDEAVEAGWLKALDGLVAHYGVSPPDKLSVPLGSFEEDDAMLAMLLECRPPIVSFHFGLPSAAAIGALRSAGIVLMMSVTSLAEGRRALDAGIDILIAQGIEAGGHRGVTDPNAPDEGLAAMALTRRLTQELEAPVIAAGGIMNGAQISDALRSGAGAAQLGTAFLLCEEAATDAVYRAAIEGAALTPSVMTRAVSGRPARCLPNALTRREQAGAQASIPDFPLPYSATGPLVAVARQAGAEGMGIHWAGANARLARALPAASLVATLAEELAASGR
jgi:nitronate monooxygenase